MDFEALRAQFGLDKIEKKEKKQDYSKFEGKDNTKNNRGGKGNAGNSGGSRKTAPNGQVDVMVTDETATAPYNFVRFPSAVLESPIEEIYGWYRKVIWLYRPQYKFGNAVVYQGRRRGDNCTCRSW